MELPIDSMIDANVRRFETLYAQGLDVLIYPSEMLVRFYNACLRRYAPSGRVLDFGFGPGNNARFFSDAGYETHGVETTSAAIPIARATLGSVERIRIISPMARALPYPDAHFDVIIANAVLYYLAAEEPIRAVCDEFNRCLRPGGFVYATMMGPRCYYITKLGRRVGADTYEAQIDALREYVYVVRDETHLKSLFALFAPEAIGFYEQSLFGDDSNFHWVFIGKKR